jgi:hypothetical protein
MAQVSPAIDPARNVLAADFGNGRIRVLAIRSGTFYGRRVCDVRLRAFLRRVMSRPGRG